MSKLTKLRLDQLLVKKALATSREKAQALILTGDVLVNDVPVDKAGAQIALDAEIRIRGAGLRFVGRGGDKIDPAFDHFGVSPLDKVALDVGASTGGFTDCMLQRGARLVYTVDVGKAQLAEKLRQDKRVVVMEEVHAKDLRPEMFVELPTLATIDVSFISVRKLLPFILFVLDRQAEILILVKPQFELGREYVEKGGVVKDIAHQHQAVRLVVEFCQSLGLKELGVFPSPLKGDKKGNQEYFVAFSRSE